jgi:hypothetical protein
MPFTKTEKLTNDGWEFTFPASNIAHQMDDVWMCLPYNCINHIPYTKCSNHVKERSRRDRNGYIVHVNRDGEAARRRGSCNPF